MIGRILHIGDMASPISGPDGHANFVHLRVRSIYSLLQGAIRPHELAELARNMRAPAVAVTDTNNLFGAYEISGAVAKQGVQPITGVTLSVGFPDDLSTAVRHPGERSYPSVALLVKDANGYVQLSKLISSAYLDVAPNEGPHATLERLLCHSGGLILLTGGPAWGFGPTACERRRDRPPLRLPAEKTCAHPAAIHPRIRPAAGRGIARAGPIRPTKAFKRARDFCGSEDLHRSPRLRIGGDRQNGLCRLFPDCV